MSRHSLAAGLVLTGGDRGVVAVVAVIALAALVVGYILLNEVLAAGQGTAKMQEIAKAVQEGASAYLNRQFRTLAIFAVIVFALLFALPADSIGERIGRSAFFLVGAVFSACIGYLGMWLSTRANLRVAAAAHTERRQPALRHGFPPRANLRFPAAANAEGRERAMRIGFRTGGVVGMMTVGLGLFGAAIVVISFAGQAPKVLEGFGFGAALLAMFM